MTERLVRSSVGRWLAGRWSGGLLVSVAAVAAVSGLIGLLDPHVPALSLLVLYILAVLAVAIGWGTALAVVAAILSVVVFAYLFVPPILGWDGELGDSVAGRCSFRRWWWEWRRGRGASARRAGCPRSSRPAAGGDPGRPAARRRGVRGRTREVGAVYAIWPDEAL